jgi:sensor histidine kinase regulating citrate/malate metabolism
MPIKDINGDIVGIWDIGIDKKVANSHLSGLRSSISKISILASILAFASFLFLSMRMMSDISNFNVSLHTNAR